MLLHLQPQLNGLPLTGLLTLLHIQNLWIRYPGLKASWLECFSSVRTTTMMPFWARFCLSLNTIFPTSPTPSPSTRIAPQAHMVSYLDSCLHPGQTTSPEFTSNAFSFWTPMILSQFLLRHPVAEFTMYRNSKFRMYQGIDQL